MMPADLAQFRDRLKASRRYLVGRIAEEDDGNRTVPDTEWIRISPSAPTSKASGTQS